MTRTLEQIQPDLAAAHRAHQATVEARSAAKALADNLRARARAGDTSVTAAALAEAEHAAEFAELPIGAKHQAVEALEAEAMVARTEAWADQVSATIPALRTEVEGTLAEIGECLDKLVQTWRIHANAVQMAACEVGSIVRGDVSPRVARNIHGVVVDGRLLSVVRVHEQLAALTDNCHKRLFAGSPKAQR
jgi:hypothetical protein